jgi:hypothetical protein
MRAHSQDPLGLRRVFFGDECLLGWFGRSFASRVSSAAVRNNRACSDIGASVASMSMGCCPSLRRGRFLGWNVNEVDM